MADPTDANILCPNQIDTVAQNILSLYPLPNTGVPHQLYNNYVAPFVIFNVVDDRRSRMLRDTSMRLLWFNSQEMVALPGSQLGILFQYQK